MFNVLVVNVGSTSFKYKLVNMENESVLAEGEIERIGSSQPFLTHCSVEKKKVAMNVDAPDYDSAIELMINMLLDSEVGAIGDLSEISAIGFKTVHAGEITGSVFITDQIIKAMEEYSSVAPAHNPPYIRAIRSFQRLLPWVPLVGVFETSFHKETPKYAHVYSVPYEWYEKYGIRKYGFHGASHRYISERVPQILGCQKDRLKIISCHLGGSSSICAIKKGESIDISMGFSPQSGIPMSTRCGDLDPFIILFLEEKGLTPVEIREALTRRGGLLGISGVSGDVRDLEQAAANGNPRAALALDLFIYEVKKYIGAYASVMSGVDVIAFTGGIGENGVNIREKVCEGLEFLGITIDPIKNRNCRSVESTISKDGSKVKVMVVPTDEEKIVARETFKVCQGCIKSSSHNSATIL